MEEKRQKFTTSIKGSLIEAIKIQSVKEKRSVGEILEELIAQYLTAQRPDTNA